MRLKIVAGNWKMNLLHDEAVSLVNEVNKGLTHIANSKDKKVIFAPPSIYLQEIVQITANNSVVGIAAQNCHEKNNGAYTGELSASMLQDIGVDYVLIGHSERREYFEESDEFLAAKVNAALQNKIQPIFCCGEKLEDRKSGNHFNLVEDQLKGGLFHLTVNEIKNTIIAYEPVWAIGTGETASADQAQEMHAHIRKLVSKKYGEEIAQEISILYGGSCKPSNAKELFSCEDVDGGLIGGASLKSNDFLAIINSL